MASKVIEVINGHTRIDIQENYNAYDEYDLRFDDKTYDANTDEERYAIEVITYYAPMMARLLHKINMGGLPTPFSKYEWDEFQNIVRALNDEVEVEGIDY